MQPAQPAQPAPRTSGSGSYRVGRLHRGWPGWLLAVMALNVTAAAVYGAVGLLQGTLGIPRDWLDGTPFGSWALPAIALLVTVGVPQLVLAALAFAGIRAAIPAGYLMGVGLVAWIAVQLLVFRRYFVLQPVVVGFGVIEIALAWWWSRAAHLRWNGR